MAATERLHQLFILNICLQVFDGIATYNGVRLYWAEANPLLLAVIPALGLGQTMLIFKTKACIFLVLLRRVGASPLVNGALAMLAAVYGLFSFLPWMAHFASLVV